MVPWVGLSGPKVFWFPARQRDRADSRADIRILPTMNYGSSWLSSLHRKPSLESGQHLLKSRIDTTLDAYLHRNFRKNRGLRTKAIPFLDCLHSGFRIRWLVLTGWPKVGSPQPLAKRWRTFMPESPFDMHMVLPDPRFQF